MGTLGFSGFRVLGVEALGGFRGRWGFFGLEGFGALMFLGLGGLEGFWGVLSFLPPIARANASSLLSSARVISRL